MIIVTIIRHGESTDNPLRFLSSFPFHQSNSISTESCLGWVERRPTALRFRRFCSLSLWKPLKQTRSARQQASKSAGRIPRLNKDRRDLFLSFTSGSSYRKGHPGWPAKPATSHPQPNPPRAALWYRRRIPLLLYISRRNIP
ncbi:hypothetical protein IW261DRAFT_1612602 [Armillaria novae-zelandiae]|uniref:Uncharacterized protein n=1 Tax=Armillaria novae-zelandiae TaxID=153914 RepID=A0AA39T7V1_9AGAR|nr:hypothetical protein IW261DRAFT_1612602 [Armillaria novae-zelandiae]